MTESHDVVDAVDTTPAALRRAARLWGGREAIADVQPGSERRLTWSELAAEVERFAAGLVRRGVGPGDRVALWAPNTWQWVVAALGVQYAGGVVVPVNTRYTGVETLELLQRTRAVAVVVAGEFLGAERVAQLAEAARGPLSAAAPTLRTLVVVPLGGADTATTDVESLTVDEVLALADDGSLDEARRRADAVTGDDVADILFTSGTTGRSKGVVALHRQSVAGARAWGRNGGVGPEDRYLVLNPFFHSFGYKAGILVCALYGATIVPMAVYRPDGAMTLVERERITVLPGAPTIFQTLLDDPDRPERDLSSLRLAVTGASIVPVVLVRRMQTDLGLDTVVTAYGLTESSGFVTTCTADDDDETVATTCGRPFEGMEIRIGDKGEVLARGAMVMDGYLDDPEATAETLDADGWLHTGDVGEIDAAGNLRITDRLKDMFITGGFNVYPAEIEQTLSRLDGVVECAVVGVPDERMGEVGKAFVVRREGSDLDEDAVLAFCATELANFKRPRSVEFLESFPRNASGKILKTELR